MSELAGARTTPRGRHRSAAADEAIVTATLDVLRDVGYTALTMTAVIDRARVSSATLYRRFPTKQALVARALQCVSAGPAPADTGSLEGDIEAMARHIARAVERRDDVWSALWAEIGSNDELRAMNLAVVEPRRAQVAALLARAVERGELADAPNPDIVLSLLIGPLLHRALTLGEKLTPAFLRAVVGSVVAWVTTTSAGVVSTTSR